MISPSTVVLRIHEYPRISYTIKCYKRTVQRDNVQTMNKKGFLNHVRRDAGAIQFGIHLLLAQSSFIDTYEEDRLWNRPWTKIDSKRGNPTDLFVFRKQDRRSVHVGQPIWDPISLSISMLGQPAGGAPPSPVLVARKQVILCSTHWIPARETTLESWAESAAGTSRYSTRNSTSGLKSVGTCRTCLLAVAGGRLDCFAAQQARNPRVYWEHYVVC